ncbi:HEPN-associated N-terminal domain-containing protein [Rhodoferax sp.]|uniref:HEPN-associated N-terminal domain-containing protein n=1 Tax=Rhodoferax sp. TaxID=50421 RepID=UPI00275123BF|nr:HEPN-associated N-terminal domain-containing protein [Rhodoferax sp.]
MGIVKSQWLEQEERGWSDPRTWVCQSCIGEDAYLRSLVRKNLGGTSCSYCHSTRRKAAPIAALMTAILHGVKYSYNDEANAGCPYDREIVIEYQSSRDVLGQVLESEGLEWPEELINDVADAFANTGWVEAPDGDWMGSYNHERLHWSWESFAHAVKFQSRFHFQTRKRTRSYSDDLVSVHEMLPFLGQLVRQHRMVRKLPVSTILQRVRPGKHPHSVLELGPPSKEKASAGRMNPAGIPYLYLAFDERTALTETRSTTGDQVTVSQWSPARDLHVIDLSCFPRCPSVFSDKRRGHDMVQFLYKFTDEISKPVAHDGSEHIEYVPTQVVSEYFSQAFKHAKNKRVDGLIYPSAVALGGKNMVLFPQHDDAHTNHTHEAFATMDLINSRHGRVDGLGHAVI